ncbi:MAG TPA: lanthionine synthetase C family protein [Kofleriaceae bacterium]|nr:lanthionine synthetase C family protein [Kofleriaceae bacterium]
MRPSRVPDPSLSRGHAVLALVHATLERVVPDAGHAAHAERALGRALTQLARAPARPALYAGVAGIGWVVTQLVDVGDDGDDDLGAPFDRAIEQILAPPRWDKSFDLIEGLVGLGVYALARLPRPRAKLLLARVTEHLAVRAERRGPGVAWRSDPRWAPAGMRERPHLAWNLGVAHGVPGVIALLGHVAGAELDARVTYTARTLARDAVAWLLAQELPGGFAVGLGRGVAAEPARLAWCYGDPGVAGALLAAARSAGEPAWEEAALRIALRAAARPAHDSGARDACLCHGAAGLAHIFHRLYRATGEPRLATAARAWFAHTLALRTPGRGFGGFRAYGPDRTGKSRWYADPGLLTGTAGIALALAAATTDDDPAWDRALLLS